MAADLSRIIEELKRIEPSILGTGSKNWGADIQGHREKIRADFVAALTNAGEPNDEELSNLKKIPRPAKFSVSISHTQGFGAWIACARPTRIGLDIENATRIKREIVTRVCTPSEVSAAPRFEYLWCAKEAHYKAMENDQPATISQVEISGWNKLNDKFFSFEGGKASSIKGFVLESSPYILAVALHRPVST